MGVSALSRTRSVAAVAAALLIAGPASVRPALRSQAPAPAAQEALPESQGTRRLEPQPRDDSPAVRAALEDLARARRLITENDFETAAEVLEVVTASLRENAASLRDQALAFMYMALARFYVAGEDEARRLFSEAQMLDPTLEPQAIEIPRDVLDIWEEARALGALVVVTEPVGATVALDGVVQGPAPVRLPGLAPRDYVVTLSLDGYVDNRQDVSVAAGQTTPVSIELTPAVAAELPSPAEVEAPPVVVQTPETPSVEEESGGGGNAMLWAIPVIGGIVGAAAAAAGGGGGGGGGFTPTYVPPVSTTSNRAPVAQGRIDPAGIGMAHWTMYTFTGTSTDPDGDRITHTWDFGDGSPEVTGDLVTHSYGGSGNFQTFLTASDGQATHTQTATIRVAPDMTGTFHGSAEGTSLWLYLDQYGGEVSGSFDLFDLSTESRLADGTVFGHVDASDNFVCRCSLEMDLGRDGLFSGSLESGSNEIRGVTDGVGYYSFNYVLTRQ